MALPRERIFALGCIIYFFTLQKMLKCHEPVSAFAVYATKRKNVELSTKSKKFKGRHVSPVKKVVSKNNSKLELQGKTRQAAVNKTVQQTKISGNKIQKANKKNNIISKKTSSSITSTKNKVIQKPIVSRKNNKIMETNLKLKEPKKKLKNSLLTINKGVAKMKQVTKKQNKSRKIIKKDEQQNIYTRSKACEESHENPLNTSHSMFEWLIHPMKVEDFFQNNWEKTPVHIKRNFPNYYKLLMSTPMLDKILRESYIMFTKNIDITSYENGVRETHNPAGRAVPSVVWDYYMNGCSVRMLNPQTYISKLHSLNATLQEFFGCFVGANSYLTPPNSQGFAPHYDDIEAFILQVEGKKRWRLYKPRNESEYLPRYSSENFSEAEIGEPILDTIVNAGDLLYFPRGTIHQGETLDDTHSLHITLSVYQKNSWGDYLEKLLPEALNTAIRTDSEFRKGLPLDYLRHNGHVYSESQSNGREEFKAKVKDLFTKLIEHIDIDKAADMMAKNHVYDFLPPVLSESEQECSVVQDGEQMVANGIVKNRVEIEPDTRVRLLRSHCIRLIQEDEAYRIYYSTENSKEYHEYEPQFLEVGDEFVPAIREIILRYPEFVRVEDLPIDGDHNKSCT
ncbi:bifunctional lysine-specific demethylase and histidyl-hydroxylase NO66 isoform X2 [Megachile rotundata]|uniref:bifunctional lysine-specific demethylase and histidyl-hydroxylase NO66 isoform X2 n=1 Tax=Megachile rotundata TaxID=143995 RepID=UPI000614FE5B|nr:PREDICTED: bifunctional lysine-specific demethylase and histidyl-hydroxylase NO66 isoform X2 [Megachile rotundata]